MKNIRIVIAAAVAAALLTACGGGNDSLEVPPVAAANDVPASALVSADAYTAFALSLQSSATALPLNVTGVVPPTTETGGPRAL